LDVVGRFKNRQARDAKEREKREAAAAKQEAADAALRDQLIAATGGNFTPGPGIQDISPIKVALELVPLNYILSAIRHKTDRKCYPKNEPATSWREVRLLKAIAEDYCQHLIVPSLVDAWGKAAAKAPEKPVQRAEASPGKPAPAPENEPEASPQQPAAPSNGNAGIDPTTADAAPTRESVLAAFARNRVPPHPAPQPVPQPPPPERQAEQISDEGWEELIAGFMAGMVNWNRRRLGPEPGQPGCRAPRHILRSFRL
jgi:hypothetical protein